MIGDSRLDVLDDRYGEYIYQLARQRVRERETLLRSCLPWYVKLWPRVLSRLFRYALVEETRNYTRRVYVTRRGKRVSAVIVEPLC